MQSIADQADVSVMTVSRALKNHPGIAPATRHRIRKIARELGYRPNPLVSALMAQLSSSRALKYTPIIAYVTVCLRNETWRDYHSMVRFYTGAEQRCQELGYELQEFPLTEKGGVSAERASAILRARGIRAMIIAPLPAWYPSLSFKWNYFAAVAIGYTQKKPALHRVCNDHLGTMRISLQKLQDLGYERIGLALTHEENARVENNWLAGFCQYQYFKKPSQRVGVLLCDSFTEEVFLNWVTQQKPQVIISNTHPELQSWLGKIGLRVPEDIGLADISLRDLANLHYSGIDQHFEKVGASGVDLVVGMINNNEHGVPRDPKIVLLKGDWIPGKTLTQQVVASDASPLLRKTRRRRKYAEF